MPQFARPTEAQKEAGNYPKDRMWFQGLPITIENRRGTVRSGKDRHGNTWSVAMPYHYGYIRRTLGADGDHVDVFVGSNRQSQFVVVVNQYEQQTGKFDEIKVGLGYDSLEQAKAAYRAGYRGRNVPRAEFKTTTLQRFKEWLRLKQTWTAFDLSAKATGLTEFASGMKRLVQFRQPTKEEKPSLARRVAAIAAPAAIIGGTLAYKHYTRPAVPTKAVNPANPPPRLRTEPRMPVVGDVANVRTTRWLTKAEHSGVAPKPRDSVFYEAPRKVPTPAVAAVVPMPGAKAVKPRAKPAAKPAAKGGRKLSLGAEKVLNLVQFNDPNSAFNNMLGASDRVATAYRTGRRIVPWVKRGKKVAEDSADIASGRQVKDPFYKKAWFKAGALGAAIGAPVLAARKINAWHQQDRHFPNSVAAMSPKLGRTKEKILKAARKVDDRWMRSKPGRQPLLTAHDGPFFAARIRNGILLQSVLNHVRNFDVTADERGWDLRDARGKSARVYAPGSRKRIRREKTWDERTDNIRAVRNVAAVGALAGAAGTLVYRNKAKLAESAAKIGERTGKEKVVKAVRGALAKGRLRVVSHPRSPLQPGVTPFLRQASAKIGTVDFARQPKPALTRLIDATQKNVRAPDISEVPGAGAISYVANLPPKRRAGVFRILGAATLAGGGTLAGVARKKPKTGALLGGLGAGLLLR